jgi:hypothetical protein
VIQIWTARNEQGYEYRQRGDSVRTILDYGGLALVTTIKPPKKPRDDPHKSNPAGPGDTSPPLPATDCSNPS